MVGLYQLCRRMTFLIKRGISAFLMVIDGMLPSQLPLEVLSCIVELYLDRLTKGNRYVEHNTQGIPPEAGKPMAALDSCRVPRTLLSFSVIS